MPQSRGAMFLGVQLSDTAAYPFELPHIHPMEAPWLSRITHSQSLISYPPHRVDQLTLVNIGDSNIELHEDQNVRMSHHF